MSKKITFFAIAVAIQSLILAAMPIGRLYTLHTGKEIRVKTVPVDPYDVLSGYYVRLSYDFSNNETELIQEGEKAYVVLSRGDDGVYRYKSISKDWPAEVGEDEAVIKGTKTRGWRSNLEFGIEKYYIPEDMREKLEAEIRRWQDKGQVTVDIKVDKNGKPAIVRLIVNGQEYEY